MDAKEAKAKFEKFKKFLTDVEWQESYQLAIDALEKQIPIEPNESYDDGEISLFCPSCDRYLDGEYYFCIYCGQSLYWKKYMGYTLDFKKYIEYKEKREGQNND